MSRYIELRDEIENIIGEELLAWDDPTTPLYDGLLSEFLAERIAPRLTLLAEVDRLSTERGRLANALRESTGQIERLETFHSDCSTANTIQRARAVLAEIAP